jgi:glucokinase
MLPRWQLFGINCFSLRQEIGLSFSRQCRTWQMNNMDHEPSQALAIGLDLGGTQIRAALVTRDGRVLDRAALPTKGEGGPEAIFEQFAVLIDKVRSSIPVRDLAGIGIAAPGPLDSIEGVVLGIPTLPGWEAYPFSA